MPLLDERDNEMRQMRNDTGNPPPLGRGDRGGDALVAHRDGGNGLSIRPNPVRVRWGLADLATADGHDLRCTFTASVRALPDPIEQRSLQEVLMGSRPRLTADD